MQQPRDDPPVPPAVPGVRPLVLLRRDRHGEVWRSVEAGTGEPMLLRVGRRAPALLDEREATLQVRLISGLRRVDSQHVVRLRRVLDLPGARRALVLDLPPGQALSDLLGTTTLTPGQAVTVGIGVARGLADVHGLGLVHGDLSVESIVLAGDGRPLVTDLGVTALLGAPGSDDPSCDVRALGALVLQALGPGADDADEDVAAVRLAAEQCGEADREAGPSARAAAELLSAACPAEPLPALGPGRAGRASRLPIPVAEPQEAGRPPLGARLGAGLGARLEARLGARHVLVAGAGLAAACAATLLLGVGTPAPRGDPPPVLPTARAGPAAAAPAATTGVRADLVDGFRAAAAVRARAFGTGDLAALAAADAPGSPALAADRDAMARLAAAGIRLRGLAFSVDRVTVLHHGPAGTATVAAMVSTSAHDQVRVGGGGLVRRVPRQGPGKVRAELTLGADGGWRIRSVTW